jgi:YD repeat-containing protein
VDTSNRSKKSVFRFLRWRDLIVVVAGLAIGSWMNHRYAVQGPTDYQKWLVRPQLSSPEKARSNARPGLSAQAPCLFIVPKSAVDTHFLSGSIGDCIVLVPDGTYLDLFEVPLWGAFQHIKTDLYVPDVMNLAFTRCTIPIDDWVKRNRVYVPHVYDLFMYGDRRPYTYLDWQLPDRQDIHFQRVSPGTSYDDAIFESTSEDSTFSRSRVAWNGWGWDLNLPGGLTLLSPEAYYAEHPQQGSVVGIFDGQGHEVHLERRSNGDLTKIVSPGGKSIQLEYGGGRLIEVKDSVGHSAKYRYDAGGRLESVEYSSSSSVKYSYDSSNRIVELDASPSGIVLKNMYGSTGDIGQTEVDGDTYNFRRIADEVDVTGPRGAVTRVRFGNVNGIWRYETKTTQ